MHIIFFDSPSRTSVISRTSATSASFCRLHNTQ